MTVDMYIWASYPNTSSTTVGQDSLNSTGNSSVEPWIAIGAFNMVISSNDKLGGRLVAYSSNGRLRRVMEDHGLLYFKFKEGHVYT